LVGHASSRWLTYTALIALSAFLLLPVAWAVTSSLKPLDEVYEFPPTFGVENPRWSNYTDAVTRLPVARFMLNSLLIASVSMVGAVFTSSLAGLVLARYRFRGRTLCFALVLVSMMIPAQLLFIPRFVLADALGWIGSYKPLIIPAWLGGGAFNVFLFRQFFRTIPPEYEDAALLDGATPWMIYSRVLLPMARPAVIAAALLSFVLHWQEFLDPLIYLSDFMSYPISLGLRMYQTVAGTWANLWLATSLIALAPLVVLYALCARSVMRGLQVIESGKGCAQAP